MRAIGGMLSEGTHFLYDDYVQVGKSRLIFQRDGNLVLYDENGFTRWVSNTANRGTIAYFQDDGNFVVYVNGGRLWASNTCCHSDYELAVQRDGNVVIYSVGGGRAHWATNTNH